MFTPLEIEEGLSGVFLELIEDEDAFLEVQDTDELAAFCENLSVHSGGVSLDNSEEYLRPPMVEFITKFAAKKGYFLVTEESDRMDFLLDGPEDMEDFEDRADEIAERNREG